MKLMLQFLLIFFMSIDCQISINKTCAFFDPNKPSWCPNIQTRNNFRLNEANACSRDNLSGVKFNKNKIEQYVQLNDLSEEEEQDFRIRAENNELTIEELKILDGIILEKQSINNDNGVICRKRGCPYYKCYRRKNCTCC
jgi:hypothetical protein